MTAGSVLTLRMHGLIARQMTGSATVAYLSDLTLRGQRFNEGRDEFRSRRMRRIDLVLSDG